MVLDLLKLLLRGPGSMWSNQNLYIGSESLGPDPNVVGVVRWRLRACSF